MSWQHRFESVPRALQQVAHHHLAVDTLGNAVMPALFDTPDPKQNEVLARQLGGPRVAKVIELGDGDSYTLNGQAYKHVHNEKMHQIIRVGKRRK